MLTLFLCQNPKRPENVAEPLVGTRSHRTFQLWLHLLGNPPHYLMNASRKLGRVTWKDYDVTGVAEVVQRCERFVALGMYASGLLERLGVRHFTLPHPSGLNRLTNDREELARQLSLCRVYLQGKEKIDGSAA